MATRTSAKILDLEEWRPVWRAAVCACPTCGNVWPAAVHAVEVGFGPVDCPECDAPADVTHKGPSEMLGRAKERAQAAYEKIEALCPEDPDDGPRGG